jgi:hypothetical protein
MNLSLLEPAAAVLLAVASSAWGQGDAQFGRAGYDGFPLPSSDPGAGELRPIEQPNVGNGPLRLTSQSTFQGMRLTMGADAASTLPRGRWETRETNSWSKMWGLSDKYLLDFEVFRQTQSLVYGVTDELQAELGVGESTRFGGKLDGLVRGFHDAMGIPQSGRDRYGIGEYHFQLQGRNGARPITVDEDHGGPGLEFLYVSLHQTLTRGNNLLPAISVTLTIQSRLDDSRDMTGDAIESGLSVTFAKRFGDFYAYLSVGAAWLGDQQFHGVEMQSLGTSVLAGVEWNLGAGVSVVAQHLYSRGGLKGYGALSEPSYEISLGVKFEAGRGMLVEFAIIENIVVFDNSPDFGVHFGLTQQF